MLYSRQLERCEAASLEELSGMDPFCTLLTSLSSTGGRIEERSLKLEICDGKVRLHANERHWQAPEIQTMYSLNMPVSQLRTKMRQEFERHRYVTQIQVVDMLLFQSHAEFQVRGTSFLVHRMLAGTEGARCRRKMQWTTA